MSWGERNIAPYPQHMTGILGLIAKCHSTGQLVTKSLKVMESGAGGGEVGLPPRPLQNPRML